MNKTGIAFICIVTFVLSSYPTAAQVLDAVGWDTLDPKWPQKVDFTSSKVTESGPGRRSCVLVGRDSNGPIQAIVAERSGFLAATLIDGAGVRWGARGVVGSPLQFEILPPEAMQPCGGDVEPLPENFAQGDANPPDEGGIADGSVDMPTVDLLIVTTPSARIEAGGAEQLAVLIDLAIVSANSAYINSEITSRIRVVLETEIAYTEVSFSWDLNRLSTVNDNVLDAVHAIRTASGADLVAMIRSRGEYCGMGYLPVQNSPTSSDKGFSVTSWDCLSSQTLAHELGHNMGCCHAPNDGGGCNSGGLFPYSLGHRFFGTNGTQYRTVMAYNPGSRIDNFSNPEVDFSGTPTGVAPSSGDPGRDNAKTIMATNTAVRGFRTPALPELFATSGTFSDKVLLVWSDYAGMESYQVFRSGSNLSIGTLSANGNVQTFSDTTGESDIQYTYTVKAIKPDGSFGPQWSKSGYRAVGVPIDVSASDGTNSDGVMVTWSPSMGVTSYEVFRSKNTAIPIKISTVSDALQFLDTTVSFGTQYKYFVKSVGLLGTSSLSAVDIGFRGDPPATLAAPQNVKATDGTSTSHILVSWNSSPNANGYNIFREGTQGVIATVENSNSYQDADFDLVNGTNYTYSVKAINNSRVSEMSMSDTGYMLVKAPESVEATDGTFTDKIEVTWGWQTGAIEFQVFRNDLTDPIATTSYNDRYYIDTNVNSGSIYSYRIKTVGSVGISAYSLLNTGYRQLSAPLNVDATDGTLTTGVNVTWTAASGATGYQVWRAIGAGVAAQIGTVGAVVSYSDTTSITGTLYTYSVKATGAVGVSAASVGDAGYRQLSAPLSVAATDGTLTTGVSVTWTASTGATGYQVWRAIGAGVAAQITTIGAVLTYSDTTAVAGVSYTYTVKSIGAVAVSAASLGNTGYRNLTAPLSVAATDGTSTSEVTVTWAASTGATGYQVWRAIGAGVAAQIATVGAVQTYSNTTAVPGTSYKYTVKATGAVGVSAASIGDAGYRQLSAPLSVAATDGTLTTGVKVTWAASTGATGYKIYRDGSESALATVGAVLTYSDTTAVPGISYAYTVRAIVAAGLSAASLSNTGYRGLLAPTNVQASDGTSTSGVIVTWAAVSGATGYQILRAVGVTTPVLAGTVGVVLTFNDVEATPGILYNYSVKALSAAGPGLASTVNSGYRNLTAPLSVAATDGTSTANVTVTWAASTGATGYEVWRALGAAVATKIATVGAVQTYSNTTAVPGTSYKYTVKATGAVGVSAASIGDAGYRQLSAPLSVAATDGTLTTGVKVTWAASTGATGYKIYRDGSESALATVGAVLTYSDTTAVPGISYAYTVRAIVAAGLSAASLSNTGYRNLTAPLSVAATDGISTSEVTVTWAASTGATGYQVWRAIGSGAAVQIATVGAVLTYSDTTAVPGTSYKYTVKATGAVGVSAASLGDTGYRSLAVPLNIAATDGTLTTGVTVTWSISTGATGYEVWRALGAAVATKIATVGAVLTYSNTNAVPGTLYTYSVKATTAAGATVASASDTGYRNLTAPLSVAATDGTLTTGVTVTWAASTGATGYQVWRAIGAGVSAQIATVGAVLTYSDTTAVPGTLYTYTAKATGAVGVSAASLSNTGYRNLTAPLSVAATDGISTSEVTVTWAASIGATGYQVWRAIGAGTAAQIATVGAVLTYSNTTAVPGTSYKYTVKATGAVGVSAASLGDTGYRNRAAPTNCVASDNDLAKVRITWSLAAAGAPAVTGYEVGRSTVGGIPVVLTSALSATTVVFDDTTAIAGTSYIYTVKAKYVLVGLSPATTVTTLPTSDTGIRPAGATGGDEGGIAGGPESSTTLPGGSGNKGDESENAAGSGDSQNESTDPADDAAEIPSENEVKPEEKPDECMTIALALADQIDVLENRLNENVKDESATAITLKLLDGMRKLMESTIDNELAVCAMARGDITLDGVIDNDDLGAFLESWSAGDLIGADLNRDGRITGEDMSIVLSAIEA